MTPVCCVPGIRYKTCDTGSVFRIADKPKTTILQQTYSFRGRHAGTNMYFIDPNARLYSSGTYLNTTRGLTPDHHAGVLSDFLAAAMFCTSTACFPPKHAWSMRASPTSTHQTSTPPQPPSTHSLTPEVRPVLLWYLRQCQHITTIITITNTVITIMIRTVPTWFSLLVAASAFTLSAGNLEYKVNRSSVSNIFLGCTSRVKCVWEGILSFGMRVEHFDAS